MVLGLLACAKAPQNMTGTSDSTVAGIIGGDAVSADDPMAHTTVQIFAQTDEGIAGCTGSLIAADVVMTAGHCSVSNPNNIIIYFSKDVPADLESFLKNWRQNPLVKQVVGGVTNPAWAKLKPTTKVNWGDMSLLKIESAAPAGFQPATLISASTKLENGETITLAGFGLIQPLVNGNQVDTTELRKVDVTIKNAKYSKTEILLDTANGKGSCHGDSGGPGFVSVDGKNVIAAITSRADISTDPNGECTGNVIYTDVAPYLSWISETVAYLDSADFKPAPIAQPDLGATAKKAKAPKGHANWN